MKIDEIKAIVKLMKENDLTEFRIEEETANLCIRRNGSVSAVPLVSPPVVSVASPVPVPEKTVAGPERPDKDDKQEIIVSPLVGTFYLAPSRDAAPFVNAGDKVTKDTVVGIIEAMKVMNEIKAEKSGVIKEVLVGNGQAVEYDQPLFVLE